MSQEATGSAVEPEGLETSGETRPAHEQIAALAYALWQARGCPEGSPEEDWLNAEKQLESA